MHRDLGQGQAPFSVKQTLNLCSAFLRPTVWKVRSSRSVQCAVRLDLPHGGVRGLPFLASLSELALTLLMAPAWVTLIPLCPL